jgi:subtilisin family serine protease
MRRLYHNLAKKATVITSAFLLFLFNVLPAFAAVPNDPNYPEQSKFYRQINAEAAWDVTTGSKKVVVAFIDTGLDIWHEDIRDNIWVNPHEIPDNNKDDDLNGYVDDINGWNFVENNATVRPTVFDISDDKEAVRHGTLVGGLIGAKGNNGLWGTGLSQNISLMTLRAIRSDGSGSISAVIKAIQYAVDNGANVLSLSFMGDKFDQRVYDALRNAYDHGVVIVSAAGNYDSQTENGDTGKRVIYPGCFDAEDNFGENWILSVGSIDGSDKLSDFSEYGKCLDILAPGEYIFSTERYAPQYGYSNQFGGPWFGTSFSAPLVAGVAALIKSIHPEYTPNEVIKTILSTADPIDSVNPDYAGQLGKGKVNAGRALNLAAGTPIKRGLGNLWFFKGNQLWRFDTSSGEASNVAVLPGGKLISFTSYSTYLNDEVAVLMLRNKSYQLDVYLKNGDVRRNIVIPLSALFSENVVVRFNGLHYYLASSHFYPSTGKTEIKLYNTEKRKATSKMVSGKITQFDVDGAGNIYYSSLVRGVLTIRLLATGEAIYSLKDVAKIFDFKVVGGRLSVLLSKGSRVILISSPVNNADLAIQKIVNFEVKRKWKLKILMMADNIYYLPFSNTKANYIMLDSNLGEVQTLGINSLVSEVR